MCDSATINGVECAVLFKKMDLCIAECIVGCTVKVPMIPCGLCDRWFHIQCLGLPEGSPRCIRGLFFCLLCLEDLKELRAQSKLQRDRETRLEVVEALVKALDVEQALLRELFSCFGSIGNLEQTVVRPGDLAVDVNYAALLRESAGLKRQLIEIVSSGGEAADIASSYVQAGGGKARVIAAAANSCHKPRLQNEKRSSSDVNKITPEPLIDNLSNKRKDIVVQRVQVDQPVNLSGKQKPRCPYCFKKFLKMGFCLRHIRTMHPTQCGAVVYPYSCDRCGRKFIRKATMSCHVTKNNCTRITDIQNLDKSDCAKTKLLSTVILSDHAQINEENGTKTTVTDGSKKKGPKKRWHRGHKKLGMPFSSTYKCHLCSFRCPFWVGLQQHLETDHNLRARYRCSQCQQEFDAFKKVGCHRREQHDGLGHSQKFFVRVAGLADSEMPVCDIPFTSTVGFKTSQKIADGEAEFSTLAAGQRNVVCPHCDVGFPNDSSLLHHVRASHPQHCRYTCNRCGLKFVKQNSMFHHRTRSSCAKKMASEKHVKHIVSKDDIVKTEINDIGKTLVKTIQPNKSDSTKDKSVRCPHCNDIFSTDGFLLSHLRAKHPQQYDAKVCPFACKRCGRKFMHIKTLLFHKYQRICSNRFKNIGHDCVTAEEEETKSKNDANLLNITGSAKEDNFSAVKRARCQHCSESFFSEGFLLRHLQNKHPNIYAAKVCPSSCQKCGQKFLSKKALAFHKYNSVCSNGKVRKKPGPKIVKKSKKAAVESFVANPSDDTSRKYVCCQHCSERFNTDGFMLRHLERKHPKQYAALVCPYSCQKCGQKFFIENSLITHKYNCFKDKEYTQIKPKSVTANDVGRSEIKFDSEGITEPLKNNCNSRKKCVRCPKCNELFAGEGFLLSHLRKKHPKQYAAKVCPYSCQKCGYKFINLNTYTLHMSRGCRSYKNQNKVIRRRRRGKQLLKTNEELQFPVLEPSSLPPSGFTNENLGNRSNAISYYIKTAGPICKCHLCAFAVKRFDHLKVHLKNLHSFSILYGCPVCQAAFEYKSDLRLHEAKLHDGYFGNNYQIRKIISSESVKCSYCSITKWFENKESLHDHVNYSHSTSKLEASETMYACGACGEDFVAIAALSLHQTGDCPARRAAQTSASFNEESVEPTTEFNVEQIEVLQHIRAASAAGIVSQSSEWDSKDKAVVSVSDGDVADDHETETWAPFHLLDTEMNPEEYLDNHFLSA